MTAIRIENLSKNYKEQPVLTGVNLAVEQGEAFGILGGEHSGKSTLMRILMHLMFPTEGTAHILGMDVTKEMSSIRAKVAYIPENPIFYDHLSVAETIRYGLGSLTGGKSAEARKMLLETFALDPKAMGWELSRRERTKLSLAIALLREPDVFLLDSPFTHLAPVERSNLLKHLHAQKIMGATMLLASAHEADLLGLCDRISVLQDGVLQKPRPIESHLENQGVFVIAHGKMSQRDVAMMSYRIVVSTETEKQFFYRGPIKKLLEFLIRHEVERVQIIDAAEADLYSTHFGGDA